MRLEIAYYLAFVIRYANILNSGERERIMEVDYKTSKEQNFTCKHCGWQGKGAELSFGDFSELHSICDLDCPKCFEHIGFWQAPLIDKSSDKKE